MDPQDKKSKDYSILGKAEDRAIAMAKYKREMGINPAYKTEQNAEVSRSAKSMKNPTDRPYDVKTSPKEPGKSVDPKDSKAVGRKNNGTAGGQGFQAFGRTDRNTSGSLIEGGPLRMAKDYFRLNPENVKKYPHISPEKFSDKLEKDIYGSNANLKKKSKFEDSFNNPVHKAQFTRDYVPYIVEKIKESKSPTGLRRKASGTHTKSYDVKEPSKTEGSKPAPGKTDKKASDKSRLAPKLTNYQRMRAKQLEKEGYAGRSLTRAQAQKMAGAKSASNTSSLMSLFGISKKKTETPKATTPNKLASDFAKKNLAANQKIGKSR